MRRGEGCSRGEWRKGTGKRGCLAREVVVACTPQKEGAEVGPMAVSRPIADHRGRINFIPMLVLMFKLSKNPGPHI